MIQTTLFFPRQYLLAKSERAELGVGVAVVDVDAVVGDLDGVGLLVDAVEGVVAKQILECAVSMGCR